MDGSTTLYTFMLQCPHAVQSVQLLGSWDNFKTPYPLLKDTAKGPGHWTGCHAFEEAVCSDDPNKNPASAGGGLKMGGTYWYYYRLDGAEDYYNPVEPLTTSCPNFPGQVVNVLQVPHEAVYQTSSHSRHNSSPYVSKTLYPHNTYQIPKRIRTIESYIRTVPACTHATAHPHAASSSPILGAGYGLDSVRRPLSRRRRSLSTFSVGERLAKLILQSYSQTVLHQNGLPLGQFDRSADSGHAIDRFSLAFHRRARSAPASASCSTGHYGKSESALTHEGLPRSLQFSKRSRPLQEYPLHDRCIADSACARESSPRHALVNRPKPLPELPSLDLELCAALSFDLLAAFSDNGPTTPELQSPSLTCSSTSPGVNDSPYRSYERRNRIYDHEDGKKHSETMDHLLRSSASLQSAVSDHELYPPVLRIDTTSYDISRTPAYISPILSPLQSSSLPQNQSSTGEMRTLGFQLRRPPSIQHINGSPQKYDSGIALGEGDNPFAGDLMSELGYLSGVIA